MTKGNARRVTGRLSESCKPVFAKNAPNGGIPIVNIRSAISQFTVVCRDPTVD